MQLLRAPSLLNCEYFCEVGKGQAGQPYIKNGTFVTYKLARWCFMSHGIYDAAHGDRRFLVVRIEDRIRELCAKAQAAPEGEMNPVLRELQTALHEHTEYLRQLATKALIGETHGDGRPPVL
jgi:hypothetical protein